MKEIMFIPPYAKEQLKPNANVYSLLDKFSIYKDKTEPELSHDEWLDREALNDIYKTLDGDNNLVDLFEKLEDINLISKGDKLFAVCLLNTQEKIGQELKETRDMIERGVINLEILEKEIELSGFSSQIKETISSIISRLNDYWHDLELKGEKAG